MTKNPTFIIIEGVLLDTNFLKITLFNFFNLRISIF